MTTGANADDVHLRGVDVERDIAVGRWGDFATVRAGEPCPRCDSRSATVRTVEIGHIFKLGTQVHRRARRDRARAGRRAGHAHHGQLRHRRGAGAWRPIVECHHDDAGIVWPVAVAPFAVAIVPVGRDEAVAKAAEELYDELHGRRRRGRSSTTATSGRA